MQAIAFAHSVPLVLSGSYGPINVVDKLGGGLLGQAFNLMP